MWCRAVPKADVWHVADTYIQKTKKVYMDTRTSRNIDKLKVRVALPDAILIPLPNCVSCGCLFCFNSV